MSDRVNAELVKRFRKYGTGDWNACFHCGNCTAVCSLTEQGILFPRKEIRAMQMGLRNTLATQTEPWLCYYCGDCSESCPRDANPGEMMMVLRRFLTSVYDWTGLSALFYTSLPALTIAFLMIAFSIIGVCFVKQFNTESIMHFGHSFEKYTILGVASLILLPNIIRMFWYVVIKGKIKAPFSAYVKGIWDLILHMFTQKNMLKCEGNTFRWFEHFLIVFGYLLLLITMVFLNWFSTENTFIIWLGYIAGGVVFILTFDFILGRFKKDKELNKFTHPTDWIFVIWLFLIGLTAFIVRILIDTDLIHNNLWFYIVHLIITAPWALLVVPFGKWMHFIYRSFALYYANLKRAELKL